MLKRTLLVVGMMAALFSVQADLMVYSFEGTYTYEDINSVVSNVDIDFTYDILLDFDEPGLESGIIQNDRQIFLTYDEITYNYGSANFNPEDLYYTNNAVEYTTAYALEKTDLFKLDNSIERWNNIEFYGEDNIHTGFCNQLSFFNKTSFEVGSLFDVTEKYEDYESGEFGLSYILTGNAQLMSITDYEPPQSVPEPGSMTLIASSLIALTTIRFQRKKHPKK